MLLWGYSFIRAIPCITETTFKYQILPIRFSLSDRGGVHSTVFSAGQGDLSRQTDGTWEKAWIRYECRNGNPPGSTLLILAPTFMVCLVPYSIWIMNRLRDWLCKSSEYKVCYVLWCNIERAVSIPVCIILFSRVLQNKVVVLLNWIQVKLYISFPLLQNATSHEKEN